MILVHNLVPSFHVILTLFFSFFFLTGRRCNCRNQRCQSRSLLLLVNLTDEKSVC